ncbi:MAG TPA: hypothetical protein VH186_03170 [Chloroflexia bacterium]|nr:hypothetical protein [Chloroflexia bacterium]
MRTPSGKVTEHDFTIQIVLVPEDPGQPGSSQVEEVEKSVMSSLRHDGYKVKPAKYWQRGGTLIELLVQVAQNAVNNKELLMALFGAAAPAAKYLLNEQQRRAAREKAPQAEQENDRPVTLIMELDGASIKLEAEDVESAEKIYEKFHAAHPEVASGVTAESKLKLTASIPKEQEQLAE